MAQLLPGLDITYHPEPLSRRTAELARGADIISVFIGSTVDAAVLDALPQLRGIAARSVGLDHIDVAHAEARGVVVHNVAAYGPHTVAEFSFALLLALSRRIMPAYSALRSDERFTLVEPAGIELRGKTIGIVGTGKIGRAVAGIARGFGMQIVCADPQPDQAFALEVGAAYLPLAELLARADVISLHAPYTKENQHLLSRETLALVKPGALLINTARGELVDTEALLWALESDMLAGAALDVLEGERYLRQAAAALTDQATEPMESPEGLKTLVETQTLIHHPKVIATPHMAFFSAEARSAILSTTAENIKAMTAL